MYMINSVLYQRICMIERPLLSQLTRGIHPVLFQCWASVEDGVPTLNIALGECPVFARMMLVPTQRSPDAVLMPG